MFEELAESIEQSLESVQVRPSWTKGRVFVALSGGADSCALLHSAYMSLKDRCELIALHADHQLHRQSADWRAHCQALCNSLGVPLIAETLSVSTRGNLEAEARRARYEFFSRHLQKGDLLLLAHHQQDQLESILLRLFQGRGVMPMRAQGALGEGYFVRPFLRRDKHELIDYLVSKDIQWIEDPSNRNLDFDRNFLRQRVTGEILTRWPKALAAVQRASESAVAQQQLLQHLVGSLGDTVPWSEMPQTLELAQAWLRLYLNVRGHHHVTDAALAEFLRQQVVAGKAQLALGSEQLYAWRGTLYFERALPSMPTSSDRLAVCVPSAIDWGHYEVAFVECAANATNAIAYTGELVLTCRDRLREAEGLSLTSLKKRFQQANVPPWRRGTYPLCIDTEGLVAIPDIWQRGASKLLPSSATDPSSQARHCTVSCRRAGVSIAVA